MAHRRGPDEAAWPAAEDRFASDLLLADRIRDPWLAALTASAARAPIPIVLGGHTLVGPALRLVARQASTRSAFAMTIDPSFARQPAPGLDPSTIESDPVLVERLGEEIRRAGPDHVRPVHGGRPV